MKMSKATLQSIVVHRPEATIKSKQHMCMNNGYNYPEGYELLEDYGGYTIHIHLREKESRINSKQIPHDTELNAGLLKEPTPGWTGLDYC
jgi:hypothetical protein